MHAGMLHSLYCFLLCLQRERFTSRLFPPAEFSPDILRRTITQCAKVSGGIPEYFSRCSMGTEAVRVPGRGPSGGARASPGGSAAVLLAEEGNVFHPHQMLRSKKEKEGGKKPPPISISASEFPSFFPEHPLYQFAVNPLASYFSPVRPSTSLRTAAAHRSAGPLFIHATAAHSRQQQRRAPFNVCIAPPWNSTRYSV